MSSFGFKIGGYMGVIKGVWVILERNSSEVGLVEKKINPEKIKNNVEGDVVTWQLF